jgi:hypothetical protein
MSGDDQRDDYDDEPDRGPLAPDHIVRWPAALMKLFAILHTILMQLIALLFVLAVIAESLDDFDGALREVFQPEMLLMTLAWLLATACCAIEIRGASDLRRFRRYPWVVAGATITLLTMPPLGGWLIWLLLRRDVRARFEAVARGTITSTHPEPSDARIDRAT